MNTVNETTQTTQTKDKKEKRIEYKIQSWFDTDDLDFFHVLPKKNQQWIKDPHLIQRHKSFMDHIFDLANGVSVDWTAPDKLDLIKIKVRDYDWVFIDKNHPRMKPDNDDYLFYLDTA